MIFFMIRPLWMMDVDEYRRSEIFFFLKKKTFLCPLMKAHTHTYIYLIDFGKIQKFKCVNQSKEISDTHWVKKINKKIQFQNVIHFRDFSTFQKST